VGVTVSCKMCILVVGLLLPVVTSCVYKWSMNAIIQSKPHVMVTLTRDNIPTETNL
jgi:hypothetical protein